MNRSIAYALGATVLGATLASLSACSDKGSPTTESPSVANPDTIQIGLVLSLSGSLATGEDAKQGAETAVAQLNALGGILGKTLVLREVDDQSDANVARTKIDELMTQGVSLIIGPSANTSAAGIKDLIVANKLLAISPSATSSTLDNLSGTGAPTVAANVAAGTTPVLLRTAATDSFLATAIAQYASENAVTGSVTARRCPKITIVSETDDYGTPIATSVKRSYIALGLGISKEVGLDPDVTNASKLDNAASQSINAIDATCQIVIAQPKVAGAYMLAYQRYQKLNPTVRDYGAYLTIGGDGLRNASFIQAARNDKADKTSPSAGENAFTIAADTAPEAEFSTQDFSAFSNLFQAQFPGADVGRYASTAYDAVALLAGAIQRANTTTDIVALRQALYKISQGRKIVGPSSMTDYVQALKNGDDINYEGASGSCDFLSTGTVRSDFAVWQIVNSEYARRTTISADVLSAQTPQ